jgi:hypothetical protein
LSGSAQHLPNLPMLIVAALEAAVGQPDMGEFLEAIQGARTFADMESEVRKGLGRTGLMLFMKLDHGEIIVRRPGSILRKSCAS